MESTRDALRLAHGLLTQQIIEAFYDVYNDLDIGFVESVYALSLQIALAHRGLRAQREAPYRVQFRGQIVGDFRADLVVEDKIVVEIKTADKIVAAHERQLRNYLRASGLSVGLVLTFGERPAVRRMIWTKPTR